ncbi:SNF1-interacting protein [Vermiconidia calcicola]|uniref:SNF1-interacting protein n=1 Tax=Vermiconidia calcicola TaxID=1690605 RepID=A0ACC3MY72_9PEZI|nr:SNF1-interacting protein [Vermiconidia calcicola]
MAELHESLKYLSPIDWEDVPRDDLSSYLSQTFNAAELLVNSVPPPPSGTPFESAQPHNTTANSARSANAVHSSAARPAAPDKEHADLQKSWGKPMNYSQKENPMNVALYKMAGKDRHGAWYARHNIMEGIGFTKFSRALMREFPETLLTQGAPGAGAKRGLSAERRLERMEVDGVGKMEIYQLSAQMPPPVSPRDFLTLLHTTSAGLTDKSAADKQDGGRHVPRSFMVVSRPLTHPEAPQRSDFVRGKYESVELVREIPLHISGTNGDAADPELNPVEWIMITRSDPAGGVPRFLVDRDWACAQETIPDADADEDKQLETSEQKAEVTEQQGIAAATAEGGAPSKDGAAETSEKSAPVAVAVAQTQSAPPAAAPTGEEGGMASTLSSNLQAGVNTYAPISVASFMQRQLQPDQSSTQDLTEEDTSDSSSVGSFMSADEMKWLSTAPEEQEPRESTENLSIKSGASSSELSKSEKKSMSSHDRELYKITQQREKLDQKLAKKRETEENKLKQSQQKESSEQTKAREKMEKELKKTEERHRKEIEKLEQKRGKELKKAEERRRKMVDQNKLSLVARERDEFRNQSDLLRKENELLRDQVESLQRYNTALADKLGKVGGAEAVKSVQQEIKGPVRTDTMKKSKSMESVGSSKKGS